MLLQHLGPHRSSPCEALERTPSTGWTTALREISIQELVVVGVGSDPEPEHTLRHLEAERTIVKADSDGSILARLLEVEGPMSRICLQQIKAVISEFANRFGQPLVAIPETGRGKMLQTAFVLPAS